MIDNLLRRTLADVSEQGGAPVTPSPAETDKTQVPTLQLRRYRSLSPQLKDRFALFGAWPEATHADWLSLAEMEELWAPLSSTAIARKQNLDIIAENWQNDAVTLFKENRISIFALGEEGTERIYLLWFDCVDEPEVWVYDTNGEAHYRDLKAYLQAYLDDDLTAYEKHWLLGNG
jgi:hypothetical protein